jgi:hypothetical protein
VYVAADGSIRRVSGSAEFGSTSQRIVHRLVTLDSPPDIELPELSPTSTTTGTGTGTGTARSEP